MKKLLVFLTILSLTISNALFSALPVSSFIIKPVNLSTGVYKQSESVFTISSSDEDFSLPRSANQKVLSGSSSNGGKEITVSTGDFTLADSNKKTRYLRDTPFLNIKSREIKNTAKKFLNSKESVEDISHFVYKHISDKKEGIPFIPAISILRDRAGDCTEHSILTVSLLRAVNVPARAVIGIILSEYFAGERDVFVYHMWVEAYVNGKWVLVDSTRPGNIHHNRYIAFAYHNLTTESPLDYLNAVSAINDVRINQIR
ncbi:MAG TPA: transglutaminase domain-containing protein [Spirochaetota bacterium]|nr:transglutaminase domain-containing protein [Spirochaetota bacterium]